MTSPHHEYPLPTTARNSWTVATAVAVVLVLGTGCLAISVRVPQQSAWFYLFSLLLALIWTAGGWLVMRPRTISATPPSGAAIARISAITAVIIGGLFLIGGYIAAQIPVLDVYVNQLIDRTDHQFSVSLIAVAAITGMAEEIFFRGALFTRIPHPIWTTTLVYTVATTATGNLALVIAAAALGFLTAVARGFSGSLIPSITGHLAWTLTTIGILPLLL